MATRKIAVVTGGNKGIGYAIVKGLCQRYDGKVYLTARDEGRGNAAVAELKTLGLNPFFHQLDINDQESISKFRDYVKDTDGGIDILINNAAIAYKSTATEPFSAQAEVTVHVNYYGTINVSNILFPILRHQARVITLSSSAGHLSRIPSADLRAKFSSPTLTIEKLNELMDQFVRDAKEGTHSEKWGNSAYVVSKVGVSALTVIQQRNFDNEPENRDIFINCVHPGYVDTDMTSHKGPLTPEEGAAASLYLAIESHQLRGQYVWNNSKVVDWYAPTYPVFLN